MKTDLGVVETHTQRYPLCVGTGERRNGAHVRPHLEISMKNVNQRKRYAAQEMARRMTGREVRTVGVLKVAKALGISDSRLRHLLTDESDRLFITRFIEFVMTGPREVVHPLLDLLHRALDARSLIEVDDPAVLVAEAAVLLEKEATWDGEEDLATQNYFRGKCDGEEFARKQRRVSRANARIAEIRDLLWIGHRIELRDPLCLDFTS